MKKLSLKMKGIGEMLSREQMKNVLGGKSYEVGGNGCFLRCDSDSEKGTDVADCSVATINTCSTPSKAVCNC